MNKILSRKEEARKDGGGNRGDGRERDSRKEVRKRGRVGRTRLY